MNGRELFEGMSFVHGKYVEEAAEEELAKPEKKRIHFRKKPLLVAAIIVSVGFLMGAAIDALISMRVEKVMMHTPVLETQVIEDGSIGETWIDEWREGEEVNFDEVYDVFIELGSCYPLEIPEGYETVFISDALYQHQYIAYENDEGNSIDYIIYIPDEASSVEIYDIASKSTVFINGQEGILYEEASGYRTLVWTDGKQGYGFKLRTGDRNVDLLAMARSVGEGEPLTHSRVDKTEDAILELGDFSPLYLPSGFEEQGVLGSPIADGGGWYSYVRKWYVNKAENTRIYFEYETCHSITEDENSHDAKTVCSYFIPGYERGVAVYEEVEVCGMFGLATEEHIVWADPAVHKVYHLTSEDITGEELFKVACSIIENS